MMTEFRGQAPNTLPSMVRVSGSQVLCIDTRQLAGYPCIRVLDGDRELFSDCGPEATPARTRMWLERHYAGWKPLDS
jgi:hypothetical protein